MAALQKGSRLESSRPNDLDRLLLWNLVWIALLVFILVAIKGT
ncbi:MAG TPA: hypothetical protein VFD71_16960 [Planctomycetota bacterium]|jgi:hypothetical protein|nr:hypothetical protein [Planctomycetota bacterium]